MKEPKSVVISLVLLCVFLSGVAAKKISKFRNSDGFEPNSPLNSLDGQQHRKRYSIGEGRILPRTKFEDEEIVEKEDDLPEEGVFRSNSRETDKPEEEETAEKTNTKPGLQHEIGPVLTSEAVAIEANNTTEVETKDKGNEKGDGKNAKSKHKSKKKHRSKAKKAKTEKKTKGETGKTEHVVKATDGSTPMEMPLPTDFPNLKDIIGTGRVRRCNIKIIKAFNLLGPKVAEPQEGEANLLKYCPKNRWTCCHHRHVESSRSYFAKGQKSLKHLFRMIEEILTLFRGRMYNHVLKDMAQQKECHYVLEEYKHIKSAEEFFSEDYVAIQLKAIQNLLNELPTYIRNELTFFGSMICTICDAYDNLSFSVEENQTKIFAHSDTCNFIVDNSQFIVHFAYLFFEFIEPLTKVIKCARNLADVKYSSSSSTLRPLINFENNLNECKKSPDKNIPACQKVCNRPIHQYELIRPLTKSNIRAALRVMFYEFINTDADDFEWQTNRRKLDEPQFESISFFNPLDYDFRNYRLERPEWYFHEKGKRILYNTMAPFYFAFESAACLFVSAMVVMIAALLIV